MAEYISFQPSDFFNNVLYNGTGVAQSITGVGFQPDLTWIKCRTNAEWHNLVDAVRGDTKYSYSNSNVGEATDSDRVTSFDADGFTLGTDVNVNINSHTFVGWNWKAGTTSGLSGGTLTPTAYSINTTSKCGIYTYSGTGATATIAHGLGVAPGLIIVKRTDTTADWAVYQEKNTAAPATDYLLLNLTNVTDDDVNLWNDTVPTSTVFTIKSDAKVNNGSGTYVAYCFAPVKGYSKMGSYRGNAAADGPFVYTGFRPAFVMIKNSESVQDWNTFDDKRSTSTKNTTNFLLQPNAVAAETTGVDGTKTIDLLANGFKVRGLNNEINKTGDTHIYMAFAEFPIVSSNDVPGVAR